MLSVPLGIYVGVELLDIMVILCLGFKEIPNFSQKAISFYISTSDVWEFQFLYIFTNTCYVLFLIIATLVDVKCYTSLWFWYAFS